MIQTCSGYLISIAGYSPSFLETLKLCIHVLGNISSIGSQTAFPNMVLTDQVKRASGVDLDYLLCSDDLSNEALHLEESLGLSKQNSHVPGSP